MTRNQSSIAVLPFKNKAQQADSNFLGEGISEEIILALSRIPQLKVSSRRSSFSLQDAGLSLGQIAEKLGIENILEGTIEVHADQIRVRANLVNLAQDETIWSKSWQRNMQDLFAIQDEISLEIADQLREHFGHLEFNDHLVQSNTNSIDAFQYFLRGRQLFNRWNPQDVHLAIEYYSKALVVDPNYLDAHLGLADAYGFLATAGFADPLESWKKAKLALDFVAVREKDNPGLNYQLANYLFFTQASYAQAYNYARKAIISKPGYAEGQQFMAFLELLRANFTAADRHLHYALAMDPLNPESRFYRAYSFYRKEKFGLTIESCEELLEENPQNLPARIVRFYSLLSLGKAQQVLEELAQLPDASMMPDENLGLKILAYLQLDPQEAYRILPIIEAHAASDQSPQAHAYLFLIYAQMKKPDQAFEVLEKLFSHRSAILLLNFMDPLARFIWDDPRFENFKERIYRLDKSTIKGSVIKKKPLLSLEEQRTYQELLKKLMEREQVYLNPSLNLRGLAAQMKLHPNQLSWFINESLGLNFNDFINQYRIDHWLKLALDPANQRISLLGLAYESGFNSKSVFNTSFKKHKGLTPTNFIAQARD